jgi:hypothetical protein
LLLSSVFCGSILEKHLVDLGLGCLGVKHLALPPLATLELYCSSDIFSDIPRLSPLYPTGSSR